MLPLPDRAGIILVCGGIVCLSLCCAKPRDRSTAAARPTVESERPAPSPQPAPGKIPYAARNPSSTQPVRPPTTAAVAALESAADDAGAEAVPGDTWLGTLFVSMEGERATEGGDGDEPYLLVTGRKGDRSSAYRLPERGHWIVGRGRETSVGNVAAWEDWMAPGESAQVLVVVVDQDEGRPAAQRNLADLLRRQIPQPMAATPGTVSKTGGAGFGPDDLIGAFAVELRNEAGRPRARVRLLDHAGLAGDAASDAATLRLTGAQAEYLVTVRLQNTP